MIKKIYPNIVLSLIVFTLPIYPQHIPALNNKFNNIPQYQINIADAILFFDNKYSDNSVPNSLAEGRAEELNEALNEGKYFYIKFTAQLNCSGYNFENNTFERVVWKNIEKNGTKRVFEIKKYDKSQQEQYDNIDIKCGSLFVNMAGIIGMYKQLLFPTYVSEEIEEEYLEQDWINFSVEILFNTIETISPLETPNPQNNEPDCALIVPYAIRVQNGDALGIYFFE